MNVADDATSLFAEAHSLSTAYIRGIPERSVAPSHAALQGLAAFHKTLPEGGSDPIAVLR